MAQREVALIVSLDFDVPTKLLRGDASYNELVLREGSKVAENVSEEYHRGHLEATQAQQSTIDKLKEENHRMKQSNMEKTYAELEKMKKAHDKQLQELQKTMETLQQENTQLKTLSSCAPYIDKGKYGEMNLMDSLDTFLPEYHHEETSTQDHHGDAVTTGSGINTNIIYDSKFRKRKPEHRDYQKLFRDAQEQNSCAAIMVWFNDDENYSGPLIYVSYEDTNIPIITVRVTKNSPWIIAAAFHVAMNYVNSKRKRTHDQTKLDDFISNINTFIKNDIQTGLFNWRNVVNTAQAGKEHYEKKIMVNILAAMADYSPTTTSNKRQRVK